jgi:hypothetical protein
MLCDLALPGRPDKGTLQGAAPSASRRPRGSGQPFGLCPLPMHRQGPLILVMRPPCLAGAGDVVTVRVHPGPGDMGWKAGLAAGPKNWKSGAGCVCSGRIAQGG